VKIYPAHFFTLAQASPPRDGFAVADRSMGEQGVSAWLSEQSDLYSKRTRNAVAHSNR
jgi:hypothetical protein